MIFLHKPKGYWDFTNVSKEASKYSSRTKFQKGNSMAYKTALKNKWMDIVCNHMKSKIIKYRLIKSYKIINMYIIMKIIILKI